MINTPHIEGVSTITWGTAGQLGAPSGAIVEGIAITPRNAGPIGEIEDGNGGSVTNILLDDGFDAKVTCVHDTAKTWPVLGAAVTLTIPPYNGGSGALTPYVCFVCGNFDITTARKKEATISFPVRYRPGITSA